MPKSITKSNRLKKQITKVMSNIPIIIKETHARITN